MIIVLILRLDDLSFFISFFWKNERMRELEEERKRGKKRKIIKEEKRKDVKEKDTGKIDTGIC